MPGRATEKTKYGIVKYTEGEPGRLWEGFTEALANWVYATAKIKSHAERNFPRRHAVIVKYMKSTIFQRLWKVKVDARHL